MDHSIRDRAGHYRPDREAYQSKAAQRAADELEATGMIRMTRNQSQLQASHEHEKPAPQNQSPEPAEEKHQEHRQAHQQMPPTGRRNATKSADGADLPCRLFRRRDEHKNS